MHFEIKAFDGTRGVIAYAVEAVDEADARRQVLEQGQQPIAIRARAMWFRAKTARVPLVSFSQELVALMDAGLSLVESIEGLAEKESDPAIRRALEQIRARLFEGRTLSAALAEQPDSFPALYVATVRASERSGDIREALQRYVAYQLQVDGLRKKVVSASVYPVVLCVAGVLVTLFLLGYVVPRFSSIYEDLGSQLPLASRLLIRWGHLLEAHGMAVAIGFSSALAAGIWGVTRPAFRHALGRSLSRIPALGCHLQTYQLARLYRTVGMLLRGGTPAVTALRMSDGLLGESLRGSLVVATKSISEGQSLAAALERNGLTTPVAVRMLRVGERSGNMGEMMERIAAFYDEELARAVDLLTRLIEPLLMTVIGLIIGIIVVLMYFPIFELAGSLQ
ncbi:MAG: type II secretion system F family protein [Gammaproteobacteria bacterium]